MAPLDWDFTVPGLPAAPEPDPDDVESPLSNFRPMPSAGDSPLMTYCLKCLDPMTILEALDHDCGKWMPKAGRL